MRPDRFVGPAVLIILGLVFLLNNMGWDFPIGYLLRTFWPLILVAIGISQIAGALIGRGSLPGGVVLLTIGLLFSAQQMWGISFGDTWPLLLIAIGAIGLLRALAGPGAFANRCMKGGARR